MTKEDKELTETVVYFVEADDEAGLRQYGQTLAGRPRDVEAFARALEAHLPLQGPADPMFGWIRDEYEGMAHYLKTTDVPGSFLTLRNHGHAVTADVGFTSQAGPCVWARWKGPAEAPVLSYAFGSHFFDRHQYLFEPEARPATEPPLYRYHPERYHASHHFAENVGKAYRHRVDPRTGSPMADVIESIHGWIIEELNRGLRDTPLKDRRNAPHTSLILEAAATNSYPYGRFVQAGRQILDFPQAMLDLFANTDVDDVPLDPLKMPYGAQYLHFGPQADLELEPGWVVDGAYVESMGEPGDISFQITAVPLDHSLMTHWFVHPEPMVRQEFVGKYRTMDLATAIDTALAERLESLRQSLQRKGGDITEDLAAEAQAQGGELGPNLRVTDVSSQLAAIRIEQTMRQHEVYRKAMRLVVNALCYVTAYPDDIRQAWPEGTPQSLQVKADAKEGKPSERARSKLTSMGYVPVHLCGTHFAEELEKAKLWEGLGGHKSAHWRRGHWRRQANGPEFSLRRLKWIMPMAVGKGDVKDAPGHVYMVT